MYLSLNNLNISHFTKLSKWLIIGKALLKSWLILATNQQIRIEIFISELVAKGKIKGTVEAFSHAYQSNSG